MPKPEAEVVADEPEVETEPVETEEKPEGVVSEESKVAEETEATGAPEEKADPVEAKVTDAVNKALQAQAAKLAEARKEAAEKARIEAENRLYREELERLRAPKREVAKEPEVTLPPGFDLLPPEAQADYLEEKRARLALRKEIEEIKTKQATREETERRDRINGVIEDMKTDTENYPGFAEVFPQIEEMGRQDQAFLWAVRNDPKKYLRMAYKDLTSEKAPVLAERELEKKIQRQVKAQTTKPGARDTGATRKAVSLEEAFDAAWAQHGGVGG